MLISQIVVGNRHRKALGDIDALAASIAEVGLLQPIVIKPDGALVSGVRRLEACKRLGWDDVPVYVVHTINDALAALKAERDENTCRKDFAPSEAVAIWQTIEKLKPGPQELLSNLDSNYRRDKAAEVTGYGKSTLSKAKQVVDSGNAELIEQMDKAGNVDRAYQELRREQRREQMREQPLPVGKYRVLYADPPWQYDNSGLDQSAAAHYPTMAVGAICALPIGDLCTDESVLFLWATSPLLPEALQVLAAWGFIYKACMVWYKDRAPGLGWFLKTNHELLLIGVCQKTPHPKEKPYSIQSAEVGKHSEKPKLFYDLIESMYDGPYYELFIRGIPRKGWEGWGNELLSR